MGASVGEHRVTGSEELTPGQQAAVHAAKHWVQQLARTLKTCRLYDSLTSPAVERARLELANDLRRLLEQHGTLVLRFASDDILTEGASLYPARSREDNLALPFYRDGVRSVMFSPGVEPAELDRIIDAILSVTGHRQTEDDLVTLLWQAQFSHVQIEYVPAEAEVGGGDSVSHGPGGDGPALGGIGTNSGAYTSASEGASELAWPQDAGSADGAVSDAPWSESTEPDGESGDSASVPNGRGPGRSDDWQVDADTVEAQTVFDELELGAAPGVEGFRAMLEAERNVPTVAAAIDLCRSYLAASETAHDRVALPPFLSSVIRQAAVEAEWRQAGTALTMLEECRTPEWSVDPLAEGLCNARVLGRTVASLETLDAARLEEFIEFVRRLGDWAIDLLGPLLIESRGSRHESRLRDAIVAECRACPERLAPWLGDPRWPVVHMTVRILGEIGGDSIAGLLQAVAGHEEQAVRDEVVAALKSVSPKLSKPILIGLLDNADTRTFCALLQRLGQARDKEVAELMLGYLTHHEFPRQPIEERRAVYTALGSSGTDDVLPRLEAELHNQNWFESSNEPHRQAIAHCIVQIGTPLAKQVLQHGAQSRRVALRKTCEEMLARFKT